LATRNPPQASSSRVTTTPTMNPRMRPPLLLSWNFSAY
jgi:hypothetical protein